MSKIHVINYNYINYIFFPPNVEIIFLTFNFVDNFAYFDHGYQSSVKKIYIIIKKKCLSASDSSNDGYDLQGHICAPVDRQYSRDG